MNDKLAKLLSYCSDIDFGSVSISNQEKEFCNELHDEAISLCKSLPASIQTGALFFLMRCFRIPFGEKFTIFMRYYVPAWSVIYWLMQSGSHDNKIKAEARKHAITAHSMALLLHPLDDHLNDGQIPISHMALLFRSQAWMIMNDALNQLADGIDGGHEIVQGFMNDYCSSITNPKEMPSLDHYCDSFRKQMATWLIVPCLLMKRIYNDDKFTEDMQSAYQSFGIAWRLLDDINDIESDLGIGVKSSVYTCLPDNMKNLSINESQKNNSNKNKILKYVLENGVIGQIRQRICNELESAVSIAKRYNMEDLSNQFTCLMKPLKNAH